jgi:hypothetical protein
MKVYKVLTREEFNLYSASKACYARVPLELKIKRKILKYSQEAVTFAPSKKHPLMAFSTFQGAVFFTHMLQARRGEGIEIWEAIAEESDVIPIEDFSFGLDGYSLLKSILNYYFSNPGQGMRKLWPKDTVFCKAILLNKRCDF